MAETKGHADPVGRGHSLLRQAHQQKYFGRKDLPSLFWGDAGIVCTGHSGSTGVAHGSSTPRNPWKPRRGREPRSSKQVVVIVDVEARLSKYIGPFPQTECPHAAGQGRSEGTVFSNSNSTGAKQSALRFVSCSLRGPMQRAALGAVARRSGLRCLRFSDRSPWQIRSVLQEEARKRGRFVGSLPLDRATPT